jgi:hypothetical protein
VVIGIVSCPYPGIQKSAKNEDAEIHCADETGLCNDSYHGRSYAPRGETPAIKLHSRCERVNLISSVTNQGKVRFMVYKNKMNSQTMYIAAIVCHVLI